LRDGVARCVTDEVFCRKDGTAFPVEYTVTPIRERGELAGAVVIFRDITERRRAEDALRLSEARFRALFEQSTLSMQILSPEGVTLEVNRAWETLWGLSFGALKGYNLLDDRQLEAKGLMPSIRNGFSGEATEIPRAMYDPAETGMAGRPRWVKAFIYPVKDEHGRIHQVVLMHIDVTEQANAEEDVRRSEALYRAVARSIPDMGVFVLDRNLRYRTADGNIMPALGLTRDGIIGHTVREVFQGLGDDAVAMREDYARRAFSGESCSYESAFGDRVYGSQFVPLTDVVGEVPDVLVLVLDITDRKRADMDLRTAMEKLARSNHELDQFASVASHDLQAPLRSVTSYLEFLAQDYRGQLDDQANEYITRAVNASRRMSELIRELLQYSRVGTQGQSFSRVDMYSVLRQAEENLRKEIEDNDAQITSEELPGVMGDEMQLVRLVQNLIGNAIKFRTREERPVIRISAVRRGDEWVFGVHDNGIGIGAQYYERIFVIFQRLHTAEEYPGTGMGLALCKKIVEQHGGRMWVESGQGRGSSFYFSLPFREERSE
jgi:PAS domain S-box-containing protein